MKEIRKLQKPNNETSYSYQYYTGEYEEPLIDYVAELAEKIKPINKFDWEEGGYFCSRAISDFLYRYFGDNIENPIVKKKYLDDKKVQASIEALGYDVEKFWFLILFVYDYTFAACYNAIKFEKSTKEKMDEIALAIMQNVESYDENREIPIIYKRPVKISLEIQQKRKIVIDDPLAIMTIAWMFHEKAIEIENGSELDKGKAIRQSKGIGFELDTLPNSVHIWYFTKLFLTFFDIKPPIKMPLKERKKMKSEPSLNKKKLISRLIYIVGITNNEGFLVDEELLKGYLNKYKDFKIDNFNMQYGNSNI